MKTIDQFAYVVSNKFSIKWNDLSTEFLNILLVIF